MKTNKLTGTALDWAVAKCEERGGQAYLRDGKWYEPLCEEFLCYSTDWAQGGPIIEREKIGVGHDQQLGWIGIDTNAHYQTGDTPLIAAMRCYVASKLGKTVEVPKNLF